MRELSRSGEKKAVERTRTLIACSARVPLDAQVVSSTPATSPLWLERLGEEEREQCAFVLWTSASDVKRRSSVSVFVSVSISVFRVRCPSAGEKAPETTRTCRQRPDLTGGSLAVSNVKRTTASSILRPRASRHHAVCQRSLPEHRACNMWRRLLQGQASCTHLDRLFLRKSRRRSQAPPHALLPTP